MLKRVHIILQQNKPNHLYFRLVLIQVLLQHTRMNKYTGNGEEKAVDRSMYIDYLG